MGYTLIISEKPKAAFRIAQSLAENGVDGGKNGDAPYYKIARNNREIVVAPAVGHLFGLKQLSKGWKYPVFDTAWKPVYENKISAYTKKYFDSLQKLAEGADDFIVATDYDVEGDVIGYNVLRFICHRENAKRMKFSTLVKSELEEAYDNAMAGMDFGQVEAGLTRHQLDWYYGINITRALSLAMKSAGRFFVLSTGRVQGPALEILAAREKEIRAFVPVPFWELELHLQVDGTKITATHEKDKFWQREEAERIVKACEGRSATLGSIDTGRYRQKPPVPFDLTALQTEAYRWFGYTPMQTQNLAQGLYESGLISYPRTSSQKLPEKLDCRGILKMLAQQRTYSRHATTLLKKDVLKPNEGEKSDPAHPSIHPTGEAPKKLTQQQEKLYDLIVKRFFAVFGEEALRESVKYTFDIADNKFVAVNKSIVEYGWLEFYMPYISAEDMKFPELEKGKSYDGDVVMLDKETQPPKRYNEASIVKELEKHGLGTKATRAAIVRTLFTRGYVFGRSIEVSDLGTTVADTLGKYAPEILSEDMTRKFEVSMELVQTGKAKREDVLREAEGVLTGTLAKFKEKETDVGGTLLQAFISMRRAAKLIGKCPNCKTGDLKIIRSMKSGKRFIGCSAYPACKTGFPLPQTGTIEPMKQECKRCGKPMVVVRRAGRVFRNCIDMNCKPAGRTAAHAITEAAQPTVAGKEEDNKASSVQQADEPEIKPKKRGRKRKADAAPKENS